MNESNPKRTEKPSRKRFFRFSLRFFLLAATVSCIWLAYVSNRVRSQKRAVDRVTELGGHVGFDYQLDANMKWRTDPELPAPVWLIDLVGEDVARRVTIVNLDDGSDPTDDDLNVLECLTDLKQLTLSNRKLITDDGLVHVSGLSGLEVISLNGTNISGKGLQHIRRLQNLKGLSLANTALADDGLEYLGQLTGLQWLVLNNTAITDDGLRQLASLQGLEDLQLRGTSITDAGLKQLSVMTSLKRVLLGDQVTREGRDWLQSQLPSCNVAR